MPGGPSSLKRSKASRFPPARIKKIMQMDEDVGKLASATPVMISKSLECFMQLLIDQGVKEARTRGSKKLTAYHLKHTINNTPSFDFLLDVVSRIPDPVHGQSEHAEPRSAEAGPSRRKTSAAYNAPTPSGSHTQAGPSSSGRGRKRKTGPTPGTGDDDAFVPPPTYPYNLSSPVAPTTGRGAAPAWAGGAPAGEGPGSVRQEGRTKRERDDDYDEDEAPVMDHQPMRPGIGNLLNPSNQMEEKPRVEPVAPASDAGAGSGAVTTQPDIKGPGAEGGRGMFDDYDDDDDY